MNAIKRKVLITIVLIVILTISGKLAMAQLSPMGAMYFKNQYLGNPAMAGMKGLDVNVGYRQQWSNLLGAPSTQTISADYAFTPKAGIGLNVFNERAGVFKHTRTAGSYAYHLPLDDQNTRLSFGISLGFINDHISNEDVNGDSNDPDISNYNQRETYVDGDFGMAYTSRRLNIQAAVPNMKGLFKKDMMKGSVNRSTFFSAISYKFEAKSINGIGLEPKAVFRGIKGLKSVLDVGANLTYANRINFFGMYHSSKSSSFGIGMNYQSFSISGIYTTPTSAIRAYTAGNFEIGLAGNLFKQ